jgi:hypothetical protein
VFAYFANEFGDGVPVAVATSIVEELQVMDRFGGRGLKRVAKL